MHINEDWVAEARAVFGEYSGKERGQALLSLIASIAIAIALLDRDEPLRDGQQNSERVLRVLEELTSSQPQGVGIQRDIAPKVSAFFRSMVRRAAGDQDRLI